MLDWYDCRPKLGPDIEGSVMSTLCMPENVLNFEIDTKENPDKEFAMKKFEDLAGLNLKPG